MLIVEVEDLIEGSRKMAESLQQMTLYSPKIACDRRLGVTITFEKLGIRRLAADPRSCAWIRDLQAWFPGFCYFIHADPPLFHLRNIISALVTGDGGLETGDFVEVHHACFLAASNVALSLGEQPAVLEEAFAVNLRHEYMGDAQRLRALRALRPMLIAALEDQDSTVASLTFREAGSLTDRDPHDSKRFPTARHFVVEMLGIIEDYC